MSNPSSVFNPDLQSAKDKTAKHDDMSDATPPIGTNAKANEQKMTSKVLKFSFVYTGSTKHKVAPSVIHTHWMQAVQDAFGTDIVLINNKNQKVEAVSTLKWTDPSIHAKQFQLHQKTFGSNERRTSTFFIVHRVLTNISLNHQWTENIWDTTRIGWITTINPTFYNREQAQIKFSELLHSQLLSKKVKIPMFRISFVSPSVEKEGKTVSTKAYAVEIVSENSVHMLHVLKTLLNDAMTSFVPYSMQSKFPAAYLQAVKFQTQNMNATRVVVLQNISEAMMFYLGPHICAIPGAIDLLASPQVEDENGRHTLLVDKEAFKSVRNTITQNPTVWIRDHVSSDAQPTDEQFAGVARVKPIHDDGMSSGENSWMSASNASFMSMDLSAARDSNYFADTTNIESVFTYAEITVPHRSRHASDATEATDDGTTAVASEMTELEMNQKKELERLAESHRIATEQSTKLVEAQRVEIEQLKAQRQADLNDRLQDQRIAQERVQAQDDASSALRSETQAELSDLKLQMTAMMNSFKAVFPQSLTPPCENKRPATDPDIDDNLQSEKRQNVRSTPGKKLFPDYMDLEDLAMSQQELKDDAPESPQKK